MSHLAVPICNLHPQVRIGSSSVISALLAELLLSQAACHASQHSGMPLTWEMVCVIQNPYEPGCMGHAKRKPVELPKGKTLLYYCPSICRTLVYIG